MRELGIRSGENQNVAQMLEEALHRQSLLLVLDNFEHVVDAADLVGEMVRWSADLRVLVTSRARLRVAGEQVFEVQPLPVVREAGAPGLAHAVELFEQVATAVDPRFELARHDEDVTAICRSVDGLPLAIEIAANHLRTLPPPLLRQRLAGRLASVAAAGRDLPDRQQTIPATIDWSLQLLGPPERRLFARLSVFHGAVPLDAVEAVWPDGDVLDSLSVLVDHSLVRRTTGSRDEPRFGMLALVREHAAGLLDDDGEGGRRGRTRGVRRGVRRGSLRASLDGRGRSLARRHHRDAPGGAHRARLGRPPRGPAANRPHHRRPGRLLVPGGSSRRGPALGRRDAGP